MAAAVSEAKPRQLQVARLRQEEEESWISSEELHTDGSSDEDCGKGSGRTLHSPLPASQLTLPAQSCLGLGARNARRFLPCSAPPAAASEPATQDAPHLTETTRRLSELGIKESPCAAATNVVGTRREERLHDEMEEQEDIMLWRPKRGSLKLPHIDLSRLQQTQSGASNDAPKTAPILECGDGSATACSLAATSSQPKKSLSRFNEHQKCNCKHEETACQCDRLEGMTNDFVEAQNAAPTATEEFKPSSVDLHELKSDDGGT